MRVLIEQHGSHTAIEVKRGYKNATLIPMDAGGLKMQDFGFGVIERDWVEMPLYPIHRAAMRYLEASRFIDTSSAVIKLLKEIIVQYLMNKAEIVLAGSKKDVEKAFKELGETEQKAHRIVTTGEDLQYLGVSDLVELYNSVSADEDHVTKFPSKAIGAGKAFAAMELAHDPKVKAAAEREASKAAKAKEREEKAATRAANGGNGGSQETRPDSKMGRLVTKFEEGKAYTLEELSDACGYDVQNTRTAIGILRSKKGKVINYDRDAKTYSLG